MPKLSYNSVPGSQLFEHSAAIRASIINLTVGKLKPGTQSFVNFGQERSQERKNYISNVFHHSTSQTIRAFN